MVKKSEFFLIKHNFYNNVLVSNLFLIVLIFFISMFLVGLGFNYGLSLEQESIDTICSNLFI